MAGILSKVILLVGSLRAYGACDYVAFLQWEKRNVYNEVSRILVGVFSHCGDALEHSVEHLC